MPLQIGKIPIVVPRKYDLKEHVNNHQVDFCKAVAKRMKIIIMVENVNNLDDTIENYEDIVKKINTGFKSNNNIFCDRLEGIVEELLKEEK